MLRIKKRLNELLLEHEIINKENLNKALDIQQKIGGQLASILVQNEFVTEESIAICFCQYLHVPLIDLSKFNAVEKAVKVIPEHVARHYQLLAISRIGNVIITLLQYSLNLLRIKYLLTSIKTGQIQQRELTTL